MLNRTDNNIISKWWWSIDKTLLFSVLSVILIGMLMAFSAYPYAAEKVSTNGYLFTKRYFVYFLISFPALIVSSFLSKKHIKILSAGCFILFFFIMLLLPAIGTSIKGAKRWVDFGISIQPSEFIKPLFAIVSGWFLFKIKIFLKNGDKENFKKYRKILVSIFSSIMILLYLQPDFGMMITLSVIFATQLFIAGIPWKYVFKIILFGIFLAVFSYMTLSHVRTRVDKYLHPEKSDTYQIDIALKSIKKAGFFGGNSNLIKTKVPDVHTDFVFTAIMESFGAIVAILFIILLFFIPLRGFYLLKKEKNEFIVLACSGIFIQFLFQTFINIGSNLGITPTKGMTLPFVSYGGSSYLSFAIAFGVVLSLLRKEELI